VDSAAFPETLPGGETDASTLLCLRDELGPKTLSLSELFCGDEALGTSRATNDDHEPFTPTAAVNPTGGVTMFWGTEGAVLPLELLVVPGAESSVFASTVFTSPETPKGGRLITSSTLCAEPFGPQEGVCVGGTEGVGPLGEPVPVRSVPLSDCLPTGGGPGGNGGFSFVFVSPPSAHSNLSPEVFDLSFDFLF
jgi:hypothetical protein